MNITFKEQDFIALSKYDEKAWMYLNNVRLSRELEEERAKHTETEEIEPA